MSTPTVKVPLRLPPLAADKCIVQRSGLRWLRPNGHACRPGEVIAWCHVGLGWRQGPNDPSAPFQDEFRDFQVALAPRMAGRLVKARGTSRGGWLDVQNWQFAWSPDSVLGHLECPAEAVADLPENQSPLRALLLAGRRVTEIAEVRGAPATGWHDRVRAWWGDGDGLFGNVLSLGICEQLGIIRGARGAFYELFAQVAGPAHVAFIPDNLLVPSAPVLCSALQRTQLDRERIAENLARTLPPFLAAQAGSGAAAQDWFVAGCLLKAITQSPLTEHHDVLTAAGVKRLGPIHAVILSLSSEQDVCLRHKSLGYLVSLHSFRLREFGPALIQWLHAEFEPVRRNTEEKKRDYLTLIDMIRARTSAQILILNDVSSFGVQDVYCYAPFDKPLSNTLAAVRAKELNLMLYQLARQQNIAVVDVDALAVELGIGKHIPDGTHASGRLQRALRTQIIAILHERGVPGF
jgi:hypothetical protein